MKEISEDVGRALNRHIGFSGCGPTLIDDDYRDLTADELVEYAGLIAKEKALRAESWRQAKLSVLGEE